MNQESPMGVGAALRAQWILWAALFVGPMLFAGITLFLALTSHPDGLLGAGEADGAVPVETLRTILAVVATTIVGGAFLLPSLLPVRLADSEQGVRRFRDERDEGRREALIDALVPPLLQAYRTRAIASWAMAEGGALLAAMILLLTGMDVLPLAVLAVYAVFMVVTAPTRSRVARSVEDLLGDRGISLHEWDRRLMVS